MLVKDAIMKVLETCLLVEREKIAVLAVIMKDMFDDANILADSVKIHDSRNDTFEDLTRLAKKYIDDCDKTTMTLKETLKAAESFVNFMESLLHLVSTRNMFFTNSERERIKNVMTILNFQGDDVR